MTKAVLKNGVIHPVEPLPTNWTEGTQLQVQKAPAPKKKHKRFDIDDWFKRVEKAAAEIDPEDWERMQRAIDKHRAQAKEYAKRQAGLR